MNHKPHTQETKDKISMAKKGSKYRSPTSEIWRPVLKISKTGECGCGRRFLINQTPYEKKNGIERTACPYHQPYQWK